jgi:nitrogenase molybdenum-cofactor synthesis protein NifE
MSNSLREYYKALCFSGIYSSPHRYGYSGKLSGAMYAIGEIRDAVPVIHGSAGCGFHYKYVCRRDYLPAYNAQCTELGEKDIIFGGADKLRSTILETSGKYAPAMIAVIPAAPVDMIRDEIDNVIESLREKVDCRLISVKSEKFSHVDKRDRKNMMDQWAKNWDNHDFKTDIDFKGCGFVEAMKAMVEQVMERQQVQKRAVNICGLAWGAGGNAIMNGMAGELKELGIHVNAFLPNCTTGEIVKAPKAELNIISRRIHWAERMKEVFGTGYFHMNSFDFYRGPEGIERLYLKISEMLGMQKNAVNILSRRKQDTLDALKPVKEYFKSFSFALFTSSYSSVPYLIEKYERDFGLPLKLVCVDMKQESLELDMVPEATAGILVKNMYQALENIGSKARLLVNPPGDVLYKALGEMDYVIGGGEPESKPAGIRYIQGIGNINPMDFEGFKNSVIDLAQKIKKLQVNGSLLMDKFKYQPGHYPMLNDSNMNASRLMWEKMWVQRGREV